MIETGIVINPPGSPEARAIMAEFKRTQCRYTYGGHGQSFGGQCCERARYPEDDPKFCADHKRGNRGKFNDPKREPERWGGNVEPL